MFTKDLLEKGGLWREAGEACYDGDRFLRVVAGVWDRPDLEKEEDADAGETVESESRESAGALEEEIGRKGVCVAARFSRCDIRPEFGSWGLAPGGR